MEATRSKKSFLRSSGLDKGDMEVCGVKGRSDRISIVYREPATLLLLGLDGLLIRKRK